MEHLEFGDSRRIDAIESDPEKNAQLIQLFSAVGMDPRRILLTDLSTFSDFLWEAPKFPDVDYSWLPGETGQAYIHRLAPLIGTKLTEKFLLLFDVAPACLWTTTVVDFFDQVYGT